MQVIWGEYFLRNYFIYERAEVRVVLGEVHVRWCFKAFKSPRVKNVALLNASNDTAPKWMFHLLVL